MINVVEDYFTKGCGRCKRFDTPECSTKRWAHGLAHLRRICLAAGLTETAKWGHPCYMSGERNVALIGAFVGSFSLNFMNASLLTDPQRILQKRGPNARHADMLAFTDIAQVIEREPIIIAYLQEAIGYAQAGIKPVRQSETIDLQGELPTELVDALDCDPQFCEAFQGLTPGRQRSYVLHVNTTNNPATRMARIERFKEKVLAGKGWNEL
jgi:uncharacterized protein YdeI (YjbR/CyaY-like superfamily)